MKKGAEQEIKGLIRNMRKVCNEMGDCPLAKARQPSQLDCIACILRDVETMRAERDKLRKVMLSLTEYGTTSTKLEAATDPTLIPELKRQRAKNP